MTIELAALWTDDCMGKKDYDGDIISISTRFWPAGGGFLLVHNDRGNVTFKEGIDEIKPSATCSLVIWDGTHDKSIAGRDSVELATKDFEGESFEEIAPQVEQWAQEQATKVIEILKAAFISDNYT